MTFAAYCGFYPRKNVLKTWKRMGSYSTLREAWAEAYKNRDAFLAEQDALVHCGVELVVKSGGKPVYLPIEEWKALHAQYPLPPRTRDSTKVPG